AAVRKKPGTGRAGGRRCRRGTPARPGRRSLGRCRSAPTDGGDRHGNRRPRTGTRARPRRGLFLSLGAGEEPTPWAPDRLDSLVTPTTGGAIGPVLGGVLLERFWWGSVFLLAVPVMALLLLLGPRVLPEFRGQDAGRLGLPSAALSLPALLMVIFGVKQIAQNGASWLAVWSILAGL